MFDEGLLPVGPMALDLDLRLDSKKEFGITSDTSGSIGMTANTTPSTVNRASYAAALAGGVHSRTSASLKISDVGRSARPGLPD